jgi:hypothetical protein
MDILKITLIVICLKEIFQNTHGSLIIAGWAEGLVCHHCCSKVLDTDKKHIDFALPANIRLEQVLKKFLTNLLQEKLC